MNKRLRWALGLLLIGAVMAAIFLSPAPALMFPGLPFMGLYKHALYVLILCLFFCLFRILKGPTSSDRIVTIDIMGILIVGLCAILGVVTGRSWYIDIGIAWALQSFIGTLALAKFLEGKNFDE